jgi:hypothetical protein
MEKNLEIPPLELGFDDEPEEGVKIYELKEEVPLIHSKPDADFQLGDEIKASAEIRTSPVLTLSFIEEEEDDLKIDGLTSKADPTAHITPELKPEIIPDTLSTAILDVLSSDEHSLELQTQAEPETDSALLQHEEIKNSSHTNNEINTSDSANSAENAEEHFAPQELPKKKKKKNSLNKLVVIGTLVVALFLIGLNIIIFQPSFSSHEDEITALPIAPQPAPEVVKTLPKSEKIILTGSSTNEQKQQLSFEGIFNQQNEELALKLTITSPQPTPLTFEQIGRNEVPPTWIKKVEFDRKVFLVKEGQTVSVDVPVRIYFENQLERTRVTSNATVKISREGSSITIGADVHPENHAMTESIKIELTTTFSS